MSLKDKFIRDIRLNGPLPLNVYMDQCLFDPQFGYYVCGAGLGTDFTTAPETSQIFGELVALWVKGITETLDSKKGLHLIEIGPGRGAMMSDILRVLKQDKALASGLQITLVERSEAMADIQRQKLENFNGIKCDWVSSLDQLGQDKPTIILANEYFDCLPIRRYVYNESQAWEEVVIGEKAGELIFQRQKMFQALKRQPQQNSVEVQPGLSAAIQEISELLKKTGGAALFFDYGPDHGAPSDSLRAYKAGKQIDPLSEPGLSDLTADVDFSSLRESGLENGLNVYGPIPQGLFLKTLGLEERAKALAKLANSKAQASHILEGARVIADPSYMGQRFKAICFTHAVSVRPFGFPDELMPQ